MRLLAGIYLLLCGATLVVAAGMRLADWIDQLDPRTGDVVLILFFWCTSLALYYAAPRKNQI